MDAGGVFGAVWFALWFPFAVVTTFWFWKNSGIQPIKARSPNLVLVNDVILIVFVTLLCFQRMFRADYPCLLTLWSGFVGLIILANAYLWRCWTLYFVFNLTKCRIQHIDPDSIPFFIRNRHFISGPFLVRLLGTLNICFLFPVAFLTATQYDVLTTLIGPGVCEKSWGGNIYAAYASFYIVVFGFFAYSLRGVDDAFKVQKELKLTAVLLLVIFVIWFLFNFESTLKVFNEEEFPISTLSLVLGVMLAHGASTVWPLYHTLRPSEVARPRQSTKADKLDSLQALLNHSEGCRSFTEFLVKEFSVENIYFYQEIEEFRHMVQTQGHSKLLPQAQAIYEKYAVADAPYQVNLPALCLNELAQQMQTLAAAPDDFVPSHPEGVDWADPETPTMFDWAQNCIFKLMESDSCPRYYRSELYTKLLETVKQQTHKETVMLDMGVL